MIAFPFYLGGMILCEQHGLKGKPQEAWANVFVKPSEAEMLHMKAIEFLLWVVLQLMARFGLANVTGCVKEPW